MTYIVDPKLVCKLGRMFAGGKLAWEAFAEESDPSKKRKALDNIVRDNEPFLAKCVWGLLERGLSSPLSSTVELSRDDLMQAARRGYVKALERFDPSKGALPAFAKAWIRNEVQRTAAKDATIHKPEQIRIPIAAIRKQEAVEARSGRDATAEEMGLTDKQLRDWESQPTVLSMDSGPVYTYARTQKPLADRVANDDPNPEDLCGLAELSALRERLPPKEKEVIRRLFWCDQTIEQVAEDLDITLEVACDLRDSALSSLHDDVT